MRHFSVVAVLALASSCGGTQSSHGRASLTAKDILTQSSPAIVRIEAGGGKKGNIGTGFVIDKTGLIVTNLHVVAGEATIRVRLMDGTEYPVSLIAGADPAHDLVLLKVAAAKLLPTVRLGDSDAMSAGDQVVAIGSPLGYDYSVTNGLVSSVRPACSADDAATRGCKLDPTTVLQISAAISPGSSGGPLFNQFGEVVGVTTQFSIIAQNLNIAMPSKYVRPMVAQHAAMSTEQFASETKSPDEPGARAQESVKIARHVPNFEITVFDGCKANDIGFLVAQIEDAIQNGAPLYNGGLHEACYRIYEGTALRFERGAPCDGIRSAFGDGLLRASGLTSYTEKAWAMRDTFDGLLDVALRWAAKNPQAFPPGGPNSPSNAPPPAKPSK